MLSNAYFLAKFRFDTAENEPAKKLQNFANFPNFANPNPSRDAVGPGTHPLSSFELGGRVLHLRRQVRGLGDRVDVVMLDGGDVRERRLAKFRQNVARFRLYRLRFLQVNMRSTAFFKI